MNFVDHDVEDYSRQNIRLARDILPPPLILHTTCETNGIIVRPFGNDVMFERQAIMQIRAKCTK